MNQLIKDYTKKQNMAHPDFPELGLGNVAYVRKVFDKNQFVYTLTAANGDILLENEPKDTVQDFIFEHNLEAITIH